MGTSSDCGYNPGTRVSTLVWRSKKKEGPVFRAPPGFRDSGRPIFSTGEVISSTYQIRELLHSDDHGQVYEARDMLLEREVALRASWRDNDVPPLLPEARAPGAIHSPCVADIYGLSRHHSCEYLVAERIPGIALTQHISRVYERGELISSSEVMDTMVTLARGLSAVHGAGYAVRHLSTANITVMPGGRLVFASFALGQGQLDARPPVLAPEVVTSGVIPEPGTHAAVAVDLYALGCIAVELCTAAAPFAGDSLKALKFAHVHQRPPQLAALRADLPTELGDLVEELMSKDPHARPPSADDVLTQLRTISQRAAAAHRTVRVLIVDDDPARVRPLWSVIRRAHSCTVVDAAVAIDEAGKNLEKQVFDVILLNLDLPGTMNGLEMCMYFRGLLGGRDSTIVALGSHIKEDDVAVLQQVGIDHVWPYSPRTRRALTDLVRELAHDRVPTT